VEVWGPEWRREEKDGINKLYYKQIMNVSRIYASNVAER